VTKLYPATGNLAPKGGFDPLEPLHLFMVGWEGGKRDYVHGEERNQGGMKKRDMSMSAEEATVYMDFHRVGKFGHPMRVRDAGSSVTV